MKIAMLTTTDNPYDPSKEFDKWNDFDVSQGYHTCAYLARIVRSSDELTEAEEALAIEQAIDEIVKINVLGIYKKLLINQIE